MVLATRTSSNALTVAVSPWISYVTSTIIVETTATNWTNCVGCYTWASPPLWGSFWVYWRPLFVSPACSSCSVVRGTEEGGSCIRGSNILDLYKQKCDYVFYDYIQQTKCGSVFLWLYPTNIVIMFFLWLYPTNRVLLCNLWLHVYPANTVWLCYPWLEYWIYNVHPTECDYVIFYCNSGFMSNRYGHTSSIIRKNGLKSSRVWLGYPWFI